MPATVTDLTHVLPATATVNSDGHLEIGGCDLTEIAAQFGTPSFLVDETAGSRDRMVPAGSVVDVLPPFAGG